MKKSFRNLLSVLILSGAAAYMSGCAVADTGAFVRLQEEVESLKQEMAAQKAAAPAAPAPAPEVTESPVQAQGGGVTPEELAAFRRSLADLTNTSDEIKAELRALSARGDETRNDMRKDVMRLNAKTDETAVAVQELRVRASKISEVDRRLAAMEDRVEKVVAASRAAGTETAGATPVPTEFKSPEDMYDFALGTLRRGDPGSLAKARELFDAFIQKYPGNKLLPNVYYWRGETYYVQKDYENAILAFQDVIDKFPASEKVPDAMFKEGLSFQAMNDKKSARTIFDLVITKFPKNPLAEKAKQKLSELK